MHARAGASPAANGNGEYYGGDSSDEDRRKRKRLFQQRTANDE
jgi:hypothetical protein